MANIVAMNTMYESLGCTPDATILLYGAQGMNNIMKLSLLTDVEVDALCKILRLPGGMVPNPAGHGASITAPGCGVSMRAITILKLACYYIRH